MSELIDSNADLMAALASLGQHPSALSGGTHAVNGLVDPALPPTAQTGIMDQHLLGHHQQSYMQNYQPQGLPAHLQQQHQHQQQLQQNQHQQHPQTSFYGPADATIQFDPSQQPHPYQQSLVVGGGGGGVFASPPLGGLGGHGLQESHSPVGQVTGHAQHLDQALHQQQQQHQHLQHQPHHDVDIYADPHAGPSSAGSQQPAYYDAQLVGDDLKPTSGGDVHESTNPYAPNVPPAAQVRSSKKSKKSRPPPDPNAPPPPPKRPKPLPKKEPPPPPPGSENGESDGAATALGKPLIMPTHKEVHAIIDERFKALKRLFTKKAGLTGGPGRPPTKPQPSIAPEIVKLNEVFPHSPVLPYLTAEVTLEKPKTLLSFLGGSKTTKLSRSSSTATWYVWSLQELRSVRDGLAELHLLDEGTAWARLDDEQRCKLEAVEVDIEYVIQKVEEGMLRVFDGVVEAREDDPEPGEELVQTALETMPVNSQMSDYARLGAYAENLYVQQAYDKSVDDGNAIASSSKQLHSLPLPSVQELRTMYPGSAILPHLLPNLTLKTAKVMVNFLSGAGVTKRTPDEKTRAWYTKNITSYRHMSLALVEMRGHKATWDGLGPGFRRRLEMLENEVSERLVKLKEGRFEVFGISDDDDEMKGRAEDEAHDEGEDEDDAHAHSGSSHQQHHMLHHQHQHGVGQQLDQSHLQHHEEHYASLGDDPNTTDDVNADYSVEALNTVDHTVQPANGNASEDPHGLSHMHDHSTYQDDSIEAFPYDVNGDGAGVDDVGHHSLS